MTRLLLLALLLTPLAGTAQIYRTTDEQGNVVFTDKPPAGVSSTEPVELQQTNTTPPPPPRPAAATKPAKEEPNAAPYNVAIVIPADETSIPMGPGNFSVTANIDPTPRGNQVLQLYIDGIPWADPQQGLSWSLTNIFRGEHKLTVAVLDGEGKQLASSPPIRVFVHRPSVNFRNR
jgi:hypothetical protein